MTRDRFGDRLDATAYDDDDETVGVFESTAADQDAHYGSPADCFVAWLA